MMNKDTFQAPNGDSLHQLLQEQEQIATQLARVREELRLAEVKLQPLLAIASEAEARKGNIDCRIRIWWDAFLEGSNGQTSPHR